MRRLIRLTLSAAIVFGIFTGISERASAQVTTFEGARIIVGDGRVIENGTLVVTGDRIMEEGPAAVVQVPTGATRVNLAGKTVMPMLIDTHIHISQTRDAIIKDLKQRAYFGVSAVNSMGINKFDVLPIRFENIPGAARFRAAGRGITRPEPGRDDTPYWINTEAEGRAAVRELTVQKVDIVKIWVDDRDHKYQKLTPQLYGAIIDEAHKNGLRVTAHIFTLDDAKGLLKAGVDAFAHSVRIVMSTMSPWDSSRQRPFLVVNPNPRHRGVGRI